MKYAFPAIVPASIDWAYSKMMAWWSRLRSPALCWLWGVKTGEKVLFQGKTYLRTRGRGIEIGDNVVFNSLGRTNLVGMINATIIENRGGGIIKIGNGCGFSSMVLHSRSAVTIGNNVLCGANVRIYDHDFHSLESEFRRTIADADHIRSKPIVIEDDVFIGTNATILKGTHLGARSIVAAGSVVFGLDVPPDSMVKGNPARIVGCKR